MDPQIFITYSSKDQKVARTICSALENRGLRCWISSRNVRPGQNFQEQIVKAIRTAKVMVLVFTASANNSNEIKKELALASQNNLIVIPVRIEDVTPSEAFAYEFATRQWIDLFDDWESSISHLAELIAAAIGDHPSSIGIKVDLPSAGDASELSFNKSKSERSATASFLRRLSSHWALIAGLAVIAVAIIAYEAGAFLGRHSSPVMTADVPAPSQPRPQQNQTLPALLTPSPAPNQQAALLSAPPDISGTYSVHGTNPNGTNYRGSVTIHRNGDRYDFTWLIANGDTYRGIGLFNGGDVVVTWGQQYPVIYHLGGDRVLTGTWNNGTATETLVPD